MQRNESARVAQIGQMLTRSVPKRPRRTRVGGFDRRQRLTHGVLVVARRDSAGIAPHNCFGLFNRVSRVPHLARQPQASIVPPLIASQYDCPPQNRADRSPAVPGYVPATIGPAVPVPAPLEYLDHAGRQFGRFNVENTPPLLPAVMPATHMDRRWNDRLRASPVCPQAEFNATQLDNGFFRQSGNKSEQPVFSPPARIDRGIRQICSALLGFEWEMRP